MTDQTNGIGELSDDDLYQLLRNAQTETARRNSGRMSLSEIRRSFSDASHLMKNSSTPNFTDINRRLARIGVRMIVVDGRLFLEKDSK